jgi:hypothetical protein
MNASDEGTTMAPGTPQLTYPHPVVDYSFLTAEPEGPHDLRAIASMVGQAPAMWNHAVRFDSDRWTRRVLFATPHIEIVLFGWTSEQVTAFHDHGGATGAAYVCRGTLIEDIVEPAGPPGLYVQRTRRRENGLAFSFGADDVHRVRHDPEAGPAVSIHVYTKSDSEPRDYELRPDGTLLRLDP